MKTLIVFALTGVAGLAAWMYVTTGEVGLVPRQPSLEERQLRALEKRLAAVRRQVAAARQAASLHGAQAWSAVAAAAQEVERLGAEVESLLARLPNTASDHAAEARAAAHRQVKGAWAKVLQRAEKLRNAVQAFQRELNR